VLLQQSVLEISSFSPTFHLPPPVPPRAPRSQSSSRITRLYQKNSTACVSLWRPLVALCTPAMPDHKRLQNILNATVAAIKAKYELVHPIHRLPRELLTRIFALVVSEEYAAAASLITSGKEVRPLVSPTCLSLVCYHWRDIAYAQNHYGIGSLSQPSHLRRHSVPQNVEKPAFVLAVEGNGSPHGDEGSLIARHIQSLASRTSICELTYSGGAFESVQECVAMLPHLKRLSLTYAKSKSDPIVITLPGTLDELTYLSCTHAYPSFTSTLAALETLAISVRSGGTEKPPLSIVSSPRPQI
jgi:hypothetical protein